MLRRLRIKDFALIRELEAEFGAGLSLLTGETGSGKSIIVDALGMLAGDKATPQLVRSGADVTLVEGAFEVAPESEALRILDDAGIQSGDETVVLRREIASTGRSRVFINDSLASLALLRNLGQKLVDIHGQHDRQMLLDLETHLGWLDRYGGNSGGVSLIRDLYRVIREIDGRLEAMQLDEQERLQRVDVLEFQIGEIRRVNPSPEEKENLESERKVLSNRERILSLANETYGLLYEDEGSVLGHLNRLARLLQELESFDSRWTSFREGVREIQYRLEDLSYAVRDYTAGIDFSAGRLDQVEQRLSDLERLCRKYGEGIPAVLAFGAAAEKQLRELLAHEETSRELESEFGARLRDYEHQARRLSEKRHSDAARLERQLRKEFRSLAMERMDLRVFFHPMVADVTSRMPRHYGPDGIDHVEFLVSPNKGEDVKPLTKIASGGELSRIMLAIRTVCGCTDPDRTLIFDEVDAGIGGRAAEAVGMRLHEISRTSQVLCVTHLPQIAAFSDHHYRVEKGVVGSRTETTIECLEEPERIEELARMLGGKLITDTTRRHAREMLKHSQSSALQATRVEGS